MVPTRSFASHANTKRRFRHRFGRASAALLVAAQWLAAAPLQADIVPGMPDVIVCSVKDPTGVLPWERMVFYVSAQLRDGDTLYKSATSDPVLLKISEQGVINAANLADCDGRSVSDLRKEGKAITLTSMPPGS